MRAELLAGKGLRQAGQRQVGELLVQLLGMAFCIVQEDANDLDPGAFRGSTDLKKVLIGFVREDDQPLQDLEGTPAPAGRYRPGH